MFRVPAAAESLVEAVREDFTRPTFRRFIVMMTGWIVTMGRRTVSRTLQVMRDQLDGHWSDYHRLWSQARFSLWSVAAGLVRQVVSLLPADAPILVVVDDTVDEKDGPRVWGKGVWRDASRSSRRHVSNTFGHKWLVMCLLVHLPGIDRPWALPVLCGMCRSKKVAQALGLRPRLASDLTRQMLIRLMRWFPERKFILLGDSKVVTHRTACFAHRHRDRVTAVSRLRSDANLYDPPPVRRPGQRGRRASKGRKRPSPRQRIGQLKPIRQELQWYGRSRRKVSHVGETALWFSKNDCAVTPIRWVCVPGDAKLGVGQDAYFWCSDPDMAPGRIIELYALRWNIEVTFEESRALLGLGTTRHFCRQSVLRVVPMLLGLFTAVTLIWTRLPASKRRRCQGTPCYHKSSPTFADVLAAVRRELWKESLLAGHAKQRCLKDLPGPLRRTILWHLTAAA